MLTKKLLKLLETDEPIDLDALPGRELTQAEKAAKEKAAKEKAARERSQQEQAEELARVMKEIMDSAPELSPNGIFESDRPKTKDELAAIAREKKRREQQAADNAKRDIESFIGLYKQQALSILHDKDLDIDMFTWNVHKEVVIIKRNRKAVDGERYDLLLGRGDTLVAYRKHGGWYLIEMDHIFGNGKMGDFLGRSLPSRFGFRENIIKYIESNEW
jgi:hypothetical protein